MSRTLASRSNSRIRRLGDRVAETQQQLITFQLGQMGFLLPIEAVHKAIVFDWVTHPVPQLNFEGQLLPVLDIEQHICDRGQLQDSLSPGSQSQTSSVQSRFTPSSLATSDPAQQQVALIVQSQEKTDLVVLPIDSAPALCRVPPSSLVPLPRTYPVNCVQLMTDQSAEQSLRFLLSPELLIAQTAGA